MYENFILGLIQGICEWLPVSSEGMILLAKNTFLQSQDSFETAIKQALFLHFGTFLAALIYFYKDVGTLLKGLFSFKTQSADIKNLLIYLIISTLISGIFGFSLLKGVSHLTQSFDPNGRPITTLIGCLLILTGLLELKAKRSGYRNLKDIKLIDGITLGIVQGFAALPGFSRSGLTVSALLLSKFDKACALKLSFLMSLPIVLGGNIILHANELSISLETLVGLATSFVFGLATIHLLLKVAQKINFGMFVLFFGLLTLMSTLI